MRSLICFMENNVLSSCLQQVIGIKMYFIFSSFFLLSAFYLCLWVESRVESRLFFFLLSIVSSFKIIFQQFHSWLMLWNFDTSWYFFDQFWIWFRFHALKASQVHKTHPFCKFCKNTGKLVYANTRVLIQNI